MKHGYARVSSDDQTAALQRNALTAAGCTRIYEEIASGGKRDRPILAQMLSEMSKGDVLCVWKLDRLSRSLRDLLDVLEGLQVRGIGFLSVTESIDTTTAAGRLMMQMVGAFAEFERSVIRERTNAGLAAARKEGRIGGRRHKLSRAQLEIVYDWHRSGVAAEEIARSFLVHPATIRRALRRAA
jgi:DNA invertase Pin-like site-specific DNA recombinase